MSDVFIPTAVGRWKTEVYGFFAPSPAVRGVRSDLLGLDVYPSSRPELEFCLCCRFRTSGGVQLDVVIYHGDASVKFLHGSQ